MANINRDYIVELELVHTEKSISGLTIRHDELVLTERATPMKFKHHDLNSSNMFVLMKGMQEDLQLTMGLLYPLELQLFKRLIPELKGIDEDGTYVYEIELDDVTAHIGKYKYEFRVEDLNGNTVTSNSDKFRVVNCL